MGFAAGGAVPALESKVETLRACEGKASRCYPFFFFLRFVFVEVLILG